MKKTTLLPILFLLFLLTGIKTKASPGDSLSNPISISGSLYCYNSVSLLDSVAWFSFAAASTSEDFVISNPHDTLKNRVLFAFIYDTSSSTSYYTSIATLMTGNDTTLLIPATNLTIGKTYYIKTFAVGPYTVHSPTRTFGICNVAVVYTQTVNVCPTPTCGNLISNGGFETTNVTMSVTPTPVICPYPYSVATGGYSDVSCWWSPLGDGLYFNSGCSNTNFQVPSNEEGTADNHTVPPGPTSGGYAGLNALQVNYTLPYYNRLYLQQNISPMTAGVTYQVSFYAFLAPNSEWDINAANMGIYISNCNPNNVYSKTYAMYQCNTQNYITPQITAATNCSPTFNSSGQWMHIWGNYLSISGGEDWITIGNFDNSNPPAYNLTGTGSVAAAYYYIDDVSIVPVLTATASPSNVLCGTSSVTLSASNGFTNYIWTPGSSSGQTVTISPPSGTTTYTVSATDGGSCPTYTATVTVTVDPPFSVIISGSGNICTGTPVVALPSGGNSPYTYSWAPTGGTTANLTSLSSGTYSVMVTDAVGCSASTSTSFTINPDCCYLYSIACPTPLTIPSSSSSSSYTAADFTSNSCISITGPGTFTISGSFTITNCDIAMGDGATIDVPSGATLTIDNSRLYACGDMWQGIKVEAGGTLYINGSSATSPCIIEDAIDGIQMQGSAYITYGLLNNNLYDIYISQSAPDNGTAYLSLRSSVLTCQSDPGYSNNAYLKYPNLGSITNSGVYITNLGARNSIQVGDYTSSSYQNTFSNMNYGVNVTSSSFAVCNDNFEYLYGNDGQCIPSIFPFVTYAHCPSPVGIAVFANNPDLAYEYFESNLYFYQAIVGGTSSNQGNIMHECYRGVDMTNYSFPDVIDNTITNTANAYSTPTVAVYPYGDHGIYLKDLDNPLVTGNTITNFYTGIHLNDYALTGEGTYNNIGYVTSNVVSASGTSTGIMNFGIIAELLMAPNGPAVPLFIDGNSVSEASSSCVLINSVDCPLPYYDLSVDTNNLAILPSTSRTEGTQKSGIYLASAQSCIIYNNTISSSGTYIGNSPSGRADTSVIGIRSVLSQAIHECNNISNVGECMMFEGLNFPSSIDNNYMGSAYNGLVLESSGYVGKQGSATDPIGDIWQGPFSNYYTFTLNSWASYSPLYVLNSATENPAYSAANNATSNYLTGDFYIYNTNVFSATGTVPACPTGCISCKAPTRSQYQPLAQKIVDDSVPYSVFIDESKYISQQAVFTQISEDTTLMDSSTILHSFYTTTSSSTAPNNIGVLYTISADIANKNYTTAQSLNNSFTPVNLIEQNQQLVNYVYLHTLGAGIDTINKPQFDTLVGIATQCPLEGGTAVFESRSLLNRLLNTNYVFTDSCLNDSSSGHAAHRRPTTAESAIASNINAKVYPNPANTMLNIQVNLIQGQIAYFVMYNSLGEEIKSMELDNQLTTLPTNNLSAGMYYYRIIDKNGNIIKADKQLLMH